MRANERGILPQDVLPAYYKASYFWSLAEFVLGNLINNRVICTVIGINKLRDEIIRSQFIDFNASAKLQTPVPLKLDAPNT